MANESHMGFVRMIRNYRVFYFAPDSAVVANVASFNDRELLNLRHSINICWAYYPACCNMSSRPYVYTSVPYIEHGSSLYFGISPKRYDVVASNCDVIS